MGMAASQARLLTITARMHDVEYQAQSIQNAKIQLANQSDAVYQEYLEALDATTLTVKDQSGNRIQANYSSLCGPDAIKSASGKNYVFFDANNSLIVDDDIIYEYENFTGNDCFDFAMYMLGIEDLDELAVQEDAFIEDSQNGDLKDLRDRRDSIQLQLLNYGVPDGEDLIEKDDISEWWSSLDVVVEDAKLNHPESEREIEKLREEFETVNDTLRSKLYLKGDRKGLYEASGGEKDGFDYSQFNFYVEIFELMETNSYVPISSFNGSASGNAAGNSEWLQLCLKDGSITISEVSLDKNSGEVVEKGTAVSSDSSLEYTTTSSIDKTALAKAEAEYEHKSKKIDQKDKQFDMDLNKLDTERNALKTEYESVKKVISDNIERTFGIFS
jgi:hypothetical protein